MAATHAKWYAAGGWETDTRRNMRDRLTEKLIRREEILGEEA